MPTFIKTGFWENRILPKQGYKGELNLDLLISTLVPAVTYAEVISALGYTPENIANKSTNVITDQTSTTKYPNVKSVYDWATVAFATKSMNAYSMRVNNTNATANATETTYRSPGIQTYTGSIAWTGTTAPSGATTHSYNWIQVGNLVTLNITLRYAVAGSGLTAALIDLPSDCPSHVRPSGLTSAGEKLYIGSGRFSAGTTSSSSSPFVEASIKNNTTVTGFQVYMQNAASISAILAQGTIQYFTS